MGPTAATSAQGDDVPRAASMVPALMEFVETEPVPVFGILPMGTGTGQSVTLVCLATMGPTAPKRASAKTVAPASTGKQVTAHVRASQDLHPLRAQLASLVGEEQCARPALGTRQPTAAALEMVYVARCMPIAVACPGGRARPVTQRAWGPTAPIPAKTVVSTPVRFACVVASTRVCSAMFLARLTAWDVCVVVTASAISRPQLQPNAFATSVRKLDFGLVPTAPPALLRMWAAAAPCNAPRAEVVPAVE